MYKELKRESIPERRASELYKRLSTTILDEYIEELRLENKAQDTIKVYETVKNQSISDKRGS